MRKPNFKKSAMT